MFNEDVFWLSFWAAASEAFVVSGLLLLVKAVQFNFEIKKSKLNVYSFFAVMYSPSHAPLGSGSLDAKPNQYAKSNVVCRIIQSYVVRPPALANQLDGSPAAGHVTGARSAP